MAFIGSAYRSRSEGCWTCRQIERRSYDLLFRPVFLFFVVHLASRRVAHVTVTRNPSQDWTAQQIRNATNYDGAPNFLIRDRDDKFGGTFDRAAKGPAFASSRRPSGRPI